MLPPLHRLLPSFAALFLATPHLHAQANRATATAQGRITKVTSGTQTAESCYDKEGRCLRAQNRVFVYAPSGELAFELGGITEAVTRYHFGGYAQDQVNYVKKRT